eukprot:753231-Hanusia_phi.AAC.1
MKDKDWQPWFVLSVLVVMFFFLVKGAKTPETIAFIAMCVVWNAGVISTKEALSGFSNSGMLAVGVLFVVVQAIERSQLAPWAAKHVFGMRTGIRSGLFRLCTMCFFLSALLNNTPVVALLTPITRDWARTRGFPPSLFLIPLSFSTILGGLLTMIGTSTNLVISALAENFGLEKPGFFEIGYIGLPTGILGVIYLILLGPLLLPRAGGMFRYMQDKNKELITEVTLTSEFPFVGQPVEKALANLAIHRDALIKIRRGIRGQVTAYMTDARPPSEGPAAAEEASGSGGQDQPLPRRTNWIDIYPVPQNELLQEGDTLFFSGGTTTMMKLHSEAYRGLVILRGDVPDLAQDGMKFFEVVLSNRNAFVGDVVAHSSFGQFYGCSILALRRKGRSSQPISTLESRSFEDTASRTSLSHRRRIYGEVEHEREATVPLDDINVVDQSDGHVEEGEEEDAHCRPAPIEVSESQLHAGDVVLALAPAEFAEKWADTDDFLMITELGAVAAPPTPYDYFPLLVFIGMVVWVVAASSKVDMVQSAMTAAAVLVAGGWIDAKKAAGYVAWDLMLLIGSMLGMSTAITSSGLAGIVGTAMKNAGVSPLGSLFLVYGITTVMTEITTNNAAAGLIFPLAVDVAYKLEISYKPFMFT